MERREAVRRIAGEARTLISAARFEDAIQLLQDNLRIYAGEADSSRCWLWLRTNSACGNARLPSKTLVVEARSLTAAQEFDRAQGILDQALAQYSADPALVHELEAVRDARTVWQRRQAIDEVVRQATQWAGQKRYSDALRMIDWSLKEYANDPALREVKRTVEAGWEQHKRREAVAKAVADAGGLLESDQLEMR